MSKSRDIADSAATINYIDGLTSAAQTQINTKSPLSNPTFTGTATLVGVAETYNSVTSTSNATSIDLDTGTNFSHTLTENTTFTFSNPATSGKVSAFTLKVTQDTSARTITWPSSVDWAAATAPTLTDTSGGVDVFVFITHDGGTTWYGFTAGQAMG
jgi:hypothetical protein